MAIVNENDKIIVEETEVVDIAPDLVEIKKGSELFGSTSEGTGQDYGTGISNIARPYQSPNFKAGISGWRLNSNGIIQAVGVEIAGDITISGDVVGVSSGGTGRATLTSGAVLVGAGTSAVTMISALAGTGSFYVAATSGGAVTVKIDYNNGIITART